MNRLASDSPASRSPRRPAAALDLVHFLVILFSVLVASTFLTSCGHKVTQQQPPPPPLGQENPVEPPPSARRTEQEKPGKIDIPADAKPIFAETGTASWYGAPYHNRRASNGEVYNMHAMTAAHLTLPLGSIARITNLKTNHSAIVRITDRGPFVPGRIIDLSQAAAKAIDVYLPGTAKVRLEVLRSPTPLDSGGRWTVQIGSFAQEKSAAKFAERLQRRYQTAKVLKFKSPVGTWWVRIRVLEDDRQRATAVVRETQTVEGSVFLVRLD